MTKKKIYTSKDILNLVIDGALLVGNTSLLIACTRGSDSIQFKDNEDFEILEKQKDGTYAVVKNKKILKDKNKIDKLFAKLGNYEEPARVLGMTLSAVLYGLIFAKTGNDIINPLISSIKEDIDYAGVPCLSTHKSSRYDEYKVGRKAYDLNNNCEEVKDLVKETVVEIPASNGESEFNTGTPVTE